MVKYFTSESVTEGHPDKVCDAISDAILDEVIRQDENARVACETMGYTGGIVVAGQITTSAYVDIPQTVRKTLCEIGYNSAEAGFDGNNCSVFTSIDEQSEDIARGTNDNVGGAGDNGMMFGYACNETEDYMPMPIHIAHGLAYRLAQARKSGEIDTILPDGKTQVTVEYEDGKPKRIDTIVISTQHKVGENIYTLAQPLLQHVIKPVLEKYQGTDFDVNDFRLLINPTGSFVKGGMCADTGLTGRKIIVDTYGGYALHGGGAFSGKDGTKVDRSGAYMARYIAKNAVASGVADRMQIQLAYAIGVPKPVSIYVDTFGTGKKSDEEIEKIIEDNFDLTPSGMIATLGLKKPIFKSTAAYGHFGEIINDGRLWEVTDMVDVFK